MVKKIIKILLFYHKSQGIINLFLMYLMTISLPVIILPQINHKKKQINNEYSYITLKIKGTGNNRIYYGKNAEDYCSKFVPPDEVYLNGINQSYIHYDVNLIQEVNNVKLIWYNDSDNLCCAFYSCTNIIWFKKKRIMGIYFLEFLIIL